MTIIVAHTMGPVLSLVEIFADGQNFHHTVVRQCARAPEGSKMVSTLH